MAILARNLAAGGADDVVENMVDVLDTGIL